MNVFDYNGAVVLKISHSKVLLRIQRFWKNKGTTEQTKANKVGIEYYYSTGNSSYRRYDEYYW